MQRRIKPAFAKGSGKDSGEILDFCRAASLVPILHAMYSGRRFEAGDWEDDKLTEVRRASAQMAYMVAERCNADQIRISNVLTVHPMYFATETPEGNIYTLGLDLMCGEIVDLGLIREVTVHGDVMDLLLANGMVSLCIQKSEMGLPLNTQIRVCARRFDLSRALPPVAIDDITKGAAELFATTALVYNINGRPLTARGLSNLVGCKVDEVADLLDTREGEDALDSLDVMPFRAGGYSLSKEEVLLYNFVEGRVNRVAWDLKVPPSSVRVAPSMGPIRVDDPITLPDGQIPYVCEGVSRSLTLWSARLGVPAMALKRTWRPNITEKEWQIESSAVTWRGVRSQLPMWFAGRDRHGH